MNTTDYLINAILVLLVIRQIRGRLQDLTSLLLPVVLVGAAGFYYLRSVPTAGDDLTLELVLAGSGAALGVLCGVATHLWRADGGVYSKAGPVAAGLWIVGMATRMGFAFATSHGAAGSVAAFSRAHRITSSQAWVAAFVLMALAEVLARLVVIRYRAHRLNSAAVSAPVAAA